ncbi:2-oxo acid dehydrogenase subunit E2 [Rubrobacter taiwanensis]|jgi:pyruvate dehydrogenase E2 component (dihydrolipoamide acetyltransferase)|uniref:Dihydrolipoamide acetyltransferase component of pyruvate dehydrogenase complex n=1 Tax=Rubrobacter taiwanensis TaxID=185139 RepID=A0A4R1BMY5_9ACTN|nr:dihydrolipoamide acetyltransferase family protein [Rubrobacter taiwanensis]TCJ18900.1 2-oxo acid dehydrogenase subunit E2 [Rubrobacter taiwanensis]
MAAELKVPRLNMDMEEATIIRWLVEEGDEVKEGDPVLEIDTDKVSFELEAPADGIVRNLRGAAGDVVPVGTTLLYIAAPGEEVPETGREAAGTPAEPQRELATSAPPREPGTDGKGRSPVRASPAARRAAAQRGLAIEAIAGSGPGGRVYLSDVLEADVRRQPREVPAPPEGEPSAAGALRREKLSRIRRIGAERTARSFAEVPHFYLRRELGADRLLELRERLKERLDPAPTLTDLLALAVARTLRSHPRLNARYIEGGEMELNPRVNLGIAVATEEGLLVPVVKGADALPLRELVPAVRDLILRAREGRLGSEDLSGGTFTLSNLGMMEVDGFDAIINPPQAAILAVGRVRTVPEWREDEWVPRRVISATLSVDHRVADGADGARFLMDLQSVLLDWELLL